MTVAAAEDDDGDAGSATITHAVVDAESDEDYDDVADVALAVAVSDDDTAAIVVTAAENFGVTEGSTATYTVRLATKPGSDVVIQLSVTGSGVTVDTDTVDTGNQNKLTFTTTNWSTAQSVTVAAGQDDDGDAGSATITHAVVDAESDEDYDPVPNVALAVAVTDDDTAAIVVEAADNFGVTEGGTATYTVRLATKPGSDVVVQLTVAAGAGVTFDTDGDMTGNQNKLTFTTTDWSTAQTVTVAAAEDDDGDAGSATITHAVVDDQSDEDYDDVPNVALAVAVSDDDTAAIVVTAAENFGVTEGSTATYTVRLATKPGGNVVVELSVTGGSGVTVDTDDQMTGDQSKLTFTTTDWSTAQSVTVAAGQDDDGDAGSATITHAVVDAESDEDYDPVPNVTLAVAVTDDDTAAIVVEAAENFAVTEGSTATYTVRLATKPGSDVVIQLSVTSGAGMTVDTDDQMTGDQAKLTFTSSDWSTAQSVTVAAGQDDDGDAGSATITHAVVDAESDEDYDPVPNVALAVAVSDDDTAAIVVTAAENFAVTEGSTATYTVRLATKPGSDVVIQLSVTGSGVTVDTDTVDTGNQNKLTFTTTNWSTAQSVTVAAGQDDDGDAGSATITHAVVDADSDEDYDPVPNVTLAVAVTDDDTHAIVVTAAENFGVTEGGNATYSVKLATKPGSNVVVQLTVTAGVTVDTGSTDQSKLTFTPANWSTAQTVTVSAGEDDDGDPGSATITHAVVDDDSDDDYDDVADVTLAVAVSDDDTAAIVVTAAENFSVTEGSSATYSVKLATKPGGDVVVQLTVTAGVTVDTGSTDQSKLTFTPANWSTAQTVTVSAGEDDDGDPGSATITHAVVDDDSDDDYDPVPDVDLSVAVTDDDTAAILVTAVANFTVVEGSTATYSVKLATKPGGDVVVQLTVTAGVTVDTGSTDQSKLTFTPANWSTAQTVTVSAGEDDDSDPGSATITHAVVDAESDEDYDDVSDVTLAVAVTDDDTSDSGSNVGAIVVTAVKNFTVGEGRAATYTVELSRPPSSDVVIQLSVTSGAGVTVDTGSMGDKSKLTFTSTDWSTAQTVTVSAAHDDDGDPGSATITHAVVDDMSDDDYDAADDVTLAVAVTDDDTAAIVVTAAENFSVTEGSSATYSVKLATKPGGDVVVELSVTAGVTVDTGSMGDKSKLTFTSSDWSTAQSVTVSAGQDDDGDAGSATITHAVVDDESDEDYDPRAECDAGGGRD